MAPTHHKGIEVKDRDRLSDEQHTRFNLVDIRDRMRGLFENTEIVIKTPSLLHFRAYSDRTWRKLPSESRGRTFVRDMLPDLHKDDSRSEIIAHGVSGLMRLISCKVQALKIDAIICLLTIGSYDDGIQALIALGHVDRVVKGRTDLGRSSASSSQNLQTTAAKFAQALSKHFERSGEAVHIDLAIEVLLPSTDPKRDPIIVQEAHATALLLRFEAFARPADFEQLQRLCDVTPSGTELSFSHSTNPDYLVAEALFLLSDTHPLRTEKKLSAMISALQEAATRRPLHAERQAQFLVTRGRCHMARSSIFQSRDDLNGAVDALRNANALAKDANPRTASLLACALRFLSEMTLEIATLDEAIDFHWRSVRSSTTKHFYRTRLLCEAAFTLRSRFDITRNPVDLDPIIEFLREAAVAQPADPEIAFDLASGLIARYDYSNSQADADEAIIYHLRSIEHCTDDKTRASNLSHYGCTLRRLAEWTQDRVGIDNAIAAQQRAVELTPGSDTRALARYMSNLGNAYRARYEWFGDLQYLELAVDAQDRAVTAAGDEHPSLPIYLHNQALSLLSMYEHTKDHEQLEKSLAAQNRAVSLVHDDHPSKANHLLTLGSCLRTLYNATKCEDHLSKAIAVQRSALALARDGPSLPRFITNLANSLHVRFDITDDRQDIEEAIRLHEEAIALVPPGDVAQRAIYSFNLGNSLDALHRRFGENDALLRAATAFADAREALPDGDPHTAGYAAALGGVLLARAVNEQNEDMLVRAIAAHQDAFDASRGQERAHCAFGLAGAFEAQWRQQQECDGLNRAVALMHDVVYNTYGGTDPMYIANLGRLFHIRNSTGDRDAAMDILTRLTGY